MKQQILDILTNYSTIINDPVSGNERWLHEVRFEKVANDIVELIGQKNAAQKDEEKEFLEMFNRIKGNYFDRAAKRFVPTRKISKPSALHNALKQYSMEDLGKVMIGAFKDEHHMKSGWCYVTTEFVLRPQIIERYLNK